MAKVTDTPYQVERFTDAIPEETWYWAAMATIGISAFLKLSNKDHWALFVGQWPPTFLLFGLFSRLLKPGDKHRH